VCKTVAVLGGGGAEDYDDDAKEEGEKKKKAIMYSNSDFNGDITKSDGCLAFLMESEETART
jgi:hypothetical protein